MKNTRPLVSDRSVDLISARISKKISAVMITEKRIGMMIGIAIGIVIGIVIGAIFTITIMYYIRT